VPKSLLRYLGYVIYFWIGDGKEPIHVHVCKGTQQPNATKVWITENGAELEHNNSRIPEHELRKLLRHITYNQQMIVFEWMRTFGSGELKR